MRRGWILGRLTRIQRSCSESAGMGIRNGLLIQRASSSKGSELLQYLGIPLLQETNNWVYVRVQQIRQAFLSGGINSQKQINLQSASDTRRLPLESSHCLQRLPPFAAGK